MTTLKVTLKNDLEREVKQFARESDLTLEEAATELLQRTADIRNLRSLRKEGREYAKKAGVESEEDLNEAIQEWREETPEKAAGGKA